MSSDSGPGAEATIDRLRDHLTDDLDTPKALAAVDAWADEALRHGGADESAPALVRSAVDSLLGVVL